MHAAGWRKLGITKQQVDLVGRQRFDGFVCVVDFDHFGCAKSAQDAVADRGEIRVLIGDQERQTTEIDVVI